MLRIISRFDPAGAPAAVDAILELAFEARRRSRLRATLASGEEAAIILERGQILRDGDLLRAEDGRIVRVRAAPECVSTVRGASPRDLLRAAYHLGNRHVAMQIAPEQLRYLHDHVLDDMVAGMGLTVTVEDAPFEPEAGAYHSHGRSHGHAHEHEHVHADRHGA